MNRVFRPFPTPLVLLVALLLAFLLAACSTPAAQPSNATPATSGAAPTTSAASSAPKKGGIIKYGLSVDPAGLDPHIHNGAAPAFIKTMVYDTLTRYDETGKIIPGLAVSWQVPDNKTYVFTLRDGVKWHDGSPFSADDVKYTFDRILDKKNGATRQADLGMISKVEVVDPKTVKLTLSDSNASLLSVLGRETVSIVSKKFAESSGDVNVTMMGTGPFKYTNREKGVRIELRRNPDYWEADKIYLDGIDFIMYPDDRARVSAMQSGAVDIIDYVPWRNFDELENTAAFKMYATPTIISALYMNTRKPPFDNAKVRQAVASAVDPNAIAKAVFFGRASPTTGGFLPVGSYSEGQSLPYKFDVAQAKKLLAEGGYKEGTEFIIVTTSTYSFLQQTAELVQQQLVAIGMKPKIESVDFTVFGQKFNKGEFDILTSSFQIDQPDPNYMTQLFAKGSLYSNRTGYVDAKYDDLLLKGRATLTESERISIYRELNQYALQQLSIIPIVARAEGEAAATYVKGYRRLGPGLVSNNNAALRYVWLDK
ncbi:MAG: hypothetical protein HY868_17145 [Chloroflexi bacterium]|nr:hypothetical protein [Chloroflexota bacterium]